MHRPAGTRRVLNDAIAMTGPTTVAFVARWCC